MRGSQFAQFTCFRHCRGKSELASGVRGIQLEDPADVDKGIAAALVHDGPVLVDAMMSRSTL
jgi:thiamine pyrophosphate-dependent acetolactate synthase large subunit-like protein